MKLEYHRYDLTLKYAFTISRSSRQRVAIVIVRFEKDGIVAYGEASPNARYNETAETVEKFLKKIDLEKLNDPSRLHQITKYLDSLDQNNPSAKCAIDIAMHDWTCKKNRLPLYKFLGANEHETPLSSFTIGIDNPDGIIQKVKEASNYPVLKIKLGSASDEKIIDAVRSVTDKPLRVVANEGWKSKEEALDKIKWLATKNVEFIEQPMPAKQLDDVKWLRERVNLPLIADEALSDYSVEELSKAYDGINIKLQKNGGLFKSYKLIQDARKYRMKIMLGCMIESSIGITAAAHLSPLVDWNDLDGNVLISNDPFDGVVNENGELILSDAPGLGVNPKVNLEFLSLDS